MIPDALHVVFGQKGLYLDVGILGRRQGHRGHHQIEVAGIQFRELEERRVPYVLDLGERLLQAGDEHFGGGDAAGAEDEDGTRKVPLRPVERRAEMHCDKTDFLIRGRSPARTLSPRLH